MFLFAVGSCRHEFKAQKPQFVSMPRPQQIYLKIIFRMSQSLTFLI